MGRETFMGMLAVFCGFYLQVKHGHCAKSQWQTEPAQSADSDANVVCNL